VYFDIKNEEITGCCHFGRTLEMSLMSVIVYLHFVVEGTATVVEGAGGLRFVQE
jgi:hypothetical protein